MKGFIIFLLASLYCCKVDAQKTIHLRNLWARPQVHIKFKEYTISFTIRDINRALQLLNETGDSTYGTNCNLDTSGNYYFELLESTRTEYHTQMQPLIQNGVGCFLLLNGKAFIETQKHKHLSAITLDVEDLVNEENFAYYHVYDPITKKLLFTGKMVLDMYNKDLGIDYY